MKNTLLLLALAAGFTFTSCSKDDDVAQQTKTEMLTGKKWKVTGATVAIDNNPAKDFYGQTASCSKDDFTVYTTDGNLTYDVGATKCASNEVQTQTGTWSFTESESKLKTTQSGSTVEQTINELTASKMVLSNTQTYTTSGQTTSYHYVTTFEVQ